MSFSITMLICDSEYRELRAHTAAASMMSSVLLEYVRSNDYRTC